MSGNNAQSVGKRAVATYLSEVDEAELSARILEAYLVIKRPKGATARQAIDALHPEDRASILRATRAALGYMQECFANVRRPS